MITLPGIGDHFGRNTQRARNIHTKLICVDVAYMIKGSFNWLSAERTNKKFIRHDTSMRYRGAQADKLIRMLAREIQDRVISKEEKVVL